MKEIWKGFLQMIGWCIGWATMVYWGGLALGTLMAKLKKKD